MRLTFRSPCTAASSARSSTRMRQVMRSQVSGRRAGTRSRLRRCGVYDPQIPQLLLRRGAELEGGEGRVGGVPTRGVEEGLEARGVGRADVDAEGVAEGGVPEGLEGGGDAQVKSPRGRRQTDRSSVRRFRPPPSLSRGSLDRDQCHLHPLPLHRCRVAPW